MYDAHNMQDVTAPIDLEIEIRSDGSVVWIHIDGITALRVCRMGKLRITDHREDNPDSEQALLELRDRVTKAVAEWRAIGNCYTGSELARSVLAALSEEGG